MRPLTDFNMPMPSAIVQKKRGTLFDGNRTSFNIAHECLDRHPGDAVAINVE